jgi:hypothetical protein
MPDDLTLSDGAVRIPLRDRSGTVRAYAIVDADDAAWVNQWRWSLSRKGYARRGARQGGRQRHYPLHRELMGLTHGDRLEVDHIDRDKLNCRRSNMRIVPVGVNRQNVGSYRGSTSAHRGVCWDARRGKWEAGVQIQGKHVYRARFDDEQAAAEAARTARARFLPFAVD